MNKTELEKEIEENIKSIGYKNKENRLSEEGEILKVVYLDLLRLDSNSNKNEEYKNRLEKIYLNRIENEKTKVNFHKEEVKILISTVSFAPITDNILDELPIEKTLRVFDKIEKVYLFHTKSASEKYQEIENKLSKKGLIVIGKEVDETLGEIRKYLHKILREEINKDETVVDITAGIKISSISMYKFAVENGIKAINWKEIQLPNYNKNENQDYTRSGKTDRIVFSTSLEVLKEALDENRQILMEINDTLEREEYSSLSNLYKKLDRDDEAFFFEKLSKVYNIENFLSLNPEKFYEKVEIFLEEILSYKHFETKIKEKIKDFILLLKIVSNTDDDGTFYDNFQNEEEAIEIYKKELKDFKITDKNFNNYYILKNDENNSLEKREIYYYLVLKFLERKYTDSNLAENLIDSIKIKILENLKESEIHKIEDSFEACYENLFENYSEDSDLKEALKTFEVKENFKEILTKAIIYDGENTLKLMDYNISIDFKEEGLVNINKFHKEMLKAIVNSKNYSVSNKDLEEIEYFQAKKEKDTGTFGTKSSSFKSEFANKVNQIIKEKLLEDKGNFLEVIKKGKEKIYQINKSFR